MVAKVYPALRLNMGSEDNGWGYYSIKMKMKDVKGSIGFAGDFEENKTLDKIYQRAISSRAKNQMVRFLANREDRFYSSVVVAARGGEPTFAPIKPKNDDVAFFYDGDGDFGILKFDGGEDYYALDGQHRITSINTLLDNTPDGRDHLKKIGVTVPKNFKEESISIIIVTTTGDEESWRKKYRRLFSALNRNAKPVDRDTIIAMDEDDLFAILTRQLITEHPFFFWDGAAAENDKVQCEGKNIKSYKTGSSSTKGPEPFFTTLQTLCSMNHELLKTTANERKWSVDINGERITKIEDYLQDRPEDNDINSWYSELSQVWTALLDALPDLHKDPKLMRVNNADEETLDHKEGTENNALFRPLIQKEVLAPLARTLLNLAEAETMDEMTKALNILTKINWSLYEAPWKHLVLIQTESGSWKMTSEDRKPRVERLKEVLDWMLGVLEKDDEEVAELKGYYFSWLNCPDEEKEKLWKDIVATRSEICG